MIIVDVRQGSLDWLEWRRQGISASEVGAAMGLSAYKSRWQLWAELTGKTEPEDLSQIPHVREGMRREKLARAWYSEEYQTLLVPTCAECASFRPLRASFDGLDDTGAPVEIKCPTEAVWAEVEALGSDSELFQRTYPQVQAQIAIARKPARLLVWMDEKRWRGFDVQPNRDFLLRLKKDVVDFVDHVKRLVPPDLDPSLDYYRPEADVTGRWARLASALKKVVAERVEIEKELQEIGKREEDLLAEMVKAMSPHAVGRGSGVEIRRTLRQGRIDYKKVVAEHLPNLSKEVLETYRQPSSLSMSAKLIDDDATVSARSVDGWM